ncbi:MAG TPA: tetratricopeptide repeat protein [Nitrospiria bacterium]|jgi:tetratricopeptide (TPR) repeat protein
MQDLWNQKGNEFFQKGNLSEALTYYQKALKVYRDANRPREIATTLGNLGNVYGSLGKLEEATLCYKEILSIYSDLEDEWGIGRTLVNMGNLHADAGNRERGEAYYLEGKDILERLGDSQGLSTLYQNLGLLTRDQKRFEEALSFFKTGIQHSRRTSDAIRESSILASIGKTYLLMKKPDLSLGACQDSLNLAKKIGYEMGRASALYHMVSAYEDLGNKTQAIEVLTEVIRIDEKYHLPKLQENRERLRKMKAQI